LDTKDFQDGAFGIEIVAFRKDGTSFSDQRLIRILSDVTPEKWAVEIVSSLPHLETSFTQGLEFNEGKLFEGTGDPNQAGETVIAEVDLKTGAIVRKMGLDASHFGEGITILGDELYQLTWKNQKCLVYNKSDFKSIKEFTYTGEGWGLCNDGKSLIMSDGSERIYFRSPKTFDVERTIEVYTDQGPIARLNELEYVDGLIYANIWTSNNVAVIDPATGKVIATIDATQLVQEGKGNGEVLNGIAYNSVTKKLYMTGKFWSKMFEVKVNKNVVS
jgi:YVTN family beta-propeller protein